MHSNIVQQIQNDLQNASQTDKAKFLAGFFKTGKGGYAENDKFIGITVPEQRKVVRKYKDLVSLDDIKILLSSEIHEFRLTALLLLVELYKKKGTSETQKKLYKDFYLDHTQHVNNWDLVDSSAQYILGKYLLEHNEPIDILIKLAQSKDLWEQRIAIIATQYFIRNNIFEPTLKIAEILLHHPHDLIHKAVGWMLREMGKKNHTVEVDFLNKHYKTMPRTMLRYAIEKFNVKEKAKYMAK